VRSHVLHLGAVAVVIVLAGLAMPILSDYQIYVLSVIGWTGIVAVAYDVLMGYTGYLSLAHGALFGVGAYAYANLAVRTPVGPWLSLLGAGLVTLCAGTLVGALAFRTKGLYFAVLTLGIGLVGFQLFTVLESLTGGLQGFAGIPSLSMPTGLFADPQRFALVVLLVALAITYAACYAFTESRVGRDCLAIREDPTLAQALGIGISLTRLLAFAISAFFTGIAGALFASASNFVGPDSFSIHAMGIQLLVLTVVGGMGTLWGPLLGAAVVTILSESLRSAQHLSLFLYGLMLLVVIVAAPKGIAGLLISALRSRRERAHG
jgi:branched-chain amino acid transport system permease protein